MTIEVRGVDFRNKGAELMLLAVLQNARVRDRRPRFVLHSRIEHPSRREELGLDTLVWKRRLRNGLAGAVRRHLPELIPRPLRRRLGIAFVDELGAVLDAAGYAYGDPWGPAKAAAAAEYYSMLKRQGTKIIVLPQQLGPFQDPDTRKHFTRVLQLADLVFARDRVSYQSVADLGVGTENVRLAPDFTLTLPPTLPEARGNRGPRACIVPNKQMVKKLDAETADRYPGFLATCARHLLRRGFDLFLLIHESSADDYRLAVQVRADVGAPIPIVRESDPLRLKGILAQCHVTVGSRFHGLVSALSQGVPSLGTGWSHKYQMLFDDFGCPENLVNPGDPEEEIAAKLDAMGDGPTRAATLAALRRGRERYLVEIQEMWRAVNELLADERRSRWFGADRLASTGLNVLRP